MAIKTEPFVVNLGPVHPSTHGVFRMKTTFDGEVVVDMEPVFGYLHRGIEKLAEERTYTGVIPLTDRLDYLASMSNNLAYVLAVEKLGGITVPERAEYLRVIMAELQVRAKGVGILPKELAINISAGGPVLRGSGVKWDIRKADPYSVYDRFEFEIPTGTVGDCYDRYRVRIEEMRQSVRILKQAMEQLPEGVVKGKVPHLVRPPVGEAYARIEAPKGELGFYLVSDSSIAPYRCAIRAPSLINLTALRDMVKGWKVADAIITFGSIDICMGEVDR